MDNNQIVQLLGSFVLGALLAAAGAFAWLSGRVKRDKARMLQVEQARQLAAQQVTQARKQVEQLQRECHELRLAVRPAPRPAPAAQAPVDAAEAARRYVEAKLQGPATKDDPEAFPDTLVLRRSPK
jgi:hypothetical protein